jgi:hypothetical protein
MQARVRTWLPPPQETGQSDQGDHIVQPMDTVGGDRLEEECGGRKDPEGWVEALGGDGV